jgi:hypothetical protein
MNVEAGNIFMETVVILCRADKFFSSRKYTFFNGQQYSF